MRTLRRRIDTMGAGRRGVVAMASGTLIAQLILAAVTPVLSRLYSAEAFGGYAVLVSVAAVVGPSATLRLESAVLLPRSVDDTRRILRAGLASVVAVSVLTAVGIWALAGLSLVRGLRDLPGAPYWAGAMVLTTGTFAMLSGAVMRDRQYGTIARRSVAQSSVTALAQVGLGVATAAAGGLLAGHVVGRLVGYIPLLRTIPDLRRRPAAGSYRAVARRYWRFPAVFMPSGLLNTLGTQLPLLLVAAWFGASGAGQLGMAQRLALIPSALVGVAVSNVVGAELAQRLRDEVGGARAYYLSVTRRLLVPAVVVGAALAALGPWLLPLVLGDGWRTSGDFARALAVSAGAGLIASPLSKVYVVYEASLASVLVDVSRILLVGAAAAVAWIVEADAVGAAALIFAGQAANYVITWVHGLRIVTVRGGAA